MENNNNTDLSFYIGTMGFSYRAWNGSFYPEGMVSRDYLTYYSGIFNSVEIDSTFYGTPKKSTVQRWIQSTPSEFKISLKAPQIITHKLGLVNAYSLMEEFIDIVRLLGPRLAVILLQFPPSFQVSQMGLLANFISNLPGDLYFAIEVRHPSWYAVDAPFADLLKQTHVCWAATEYPGLPEQIHLTNNYIYVRWIGRHGSYKNHDHERIDRTDRLREWLAQIQAIAPQVDKVFGYFNNDYAGFGAGTAIKFRNLIGNPVNPPQQPKQGTFFKINIRKDRE
jgi:uncharacterized protein YecE (DUF72 family)